MSWISGLVHSETSPRCYTLDLFLIVRLNVLENSHLSRRYSLAATFERGFQLYQERERKIYYRLIWIIPSFVWIGKWINPQSTERRIGVVERYCFLGAFNFSFSHPHPKKQAWLSFVFLRPPQHTDTFPWWFQFTLQVTQFCVLRIFSQNFAPWLQRLNKPRAHWIIFFFEEEFWPLESVKRNMKKNVELKLLLFLRQESSFGLWVD